MSPGLSAAEAAVLDRIEPAPILARMLDWAAVNSGSGNLSGLAEMATRIGAAMAELPGEVRRHEPAPVTAIDAAGEERPITRGAHLVLSVRPDAPRRVLLTGHMDTVFPADHPFQTCRWRDAETINGPGTADMKGGIALMLAGLAAYEAAGVADPLGYDVLINSDEEVGSLASAPLIAELARGKIAALTYEPALPSGAMAGARPGSGNWSAVIHGRSAHAGRNPQDGRNAVLAAAALALRLAAAVRPGLSVNPAKIEGGSANNVVPDMAILRWNMRPRLPEDAQHALKVIREAVAAVEAAHEVHIHLHGGLGRPPKPIDAGAERLFALVGQAAADLGQPWSRGDTGGVCDGNNIAAQGVPVIDTMGALGGAIHSAEEFVHVPSLAARARLTALTLLRIGAGGLQTGETK